MLTQNRLKELLHYDPETGIFTWIKPNANRIKAGSAAGHLDSVGYLRLTIDYKSERLHRLACLYMTGRLPPVHADHINGIKTDNRWINLRSVSKEINAKNKCIRSDNNSGVTGVYWRRDRNKWAVQVRVNRKTKTIGSFSSFDDAVIARKTAEEECGYHKNHGRPA